MPKKINLGIFLNLGSSFTSLKKSGQDVRLINEYLKRYVKEFNVFVFSYKKEKRLLPKNCSLLENKLFLHRFIYQFILPFYHFSTIKKIDVFRVMQLTGVIPAILVKIFFGKPFVFTYGYDYMAFAKLEGQKIRPILLKVLEKLAIKFASGVIVTNKKIKSELKQKYPQARLFYIPNGVDIKRFKMKDLRLEVKDRKIKILFVGRLEKQKNLDNLIKAVFLLNKEYKIELLFIGQGKLKLQLIKLAKKLNISLKIIDRVSHDQIPEFYQRTDVFVLPSFLEGHPKTLLEAMVCGLPCLVGEYPGVEEFKNKEEILITGFKTKEIASGLENLIKDNSLRKKLGQNARKRIEKDFDIEKLLKMEAAALKDVV